MSAQILLVEDDDMARQLLARVLEDAGYQVTPAQNGAIALTLLAQQTFDVVVTDIRMREIDGIKVLTTARMQPYAPEVILLTGYGSLETAVAALRGGAFNYLLKPCDSLELIACVTDAAQQHAAIKRRQEAMRVIAEEFMHMQVDRFDKNDPNFTPGLVDPPGNPFRQRYVSIGGLHIDTFSHTVAIDGQPLHVTRTEFAILARLAETPEQAVPATDIVQYTHNYATTNADAQTLLRAHIRNLRRKMPQSYLITVRSIGYMLVDPHNYAGEFTCLEEDA